MFSIQEGIPTGLVTLGDGGISTAKYKESDCVTKRYGQGYNAKNTELKTLNIK
jgi:hypothetical protein